MNTVYAKPSYINCRGGKVDILCFGEAPGWEEYLKKEAFIGPAGQFLRRVLAAEFPKRRIALDNACPEAIDRGKGKPDPEKLNSYDSYRRKSVKKHDPKIIILLGSFAMRGFGVSGGVLKRNSEMVKVDGYHQKFICSTHPSYHLHTNMMHVSKFQEVMSTVKTLLSRKKKRTVEVITDWNEVVSRLRYSIPMSCGFDIETSSLDPNKGTILSAAIANEDEIFSFPLFHPKHLTGARERLGHLIQFWERCQQIIVHNLRFEVKWMRSLGAKDPKRIEDTYLQHWMIDEESPGGLNYLTVTELKRAPYWTKIDPYKKTGMDQCPVKDLCVYNGLDALGSLDLHQKWLDHPDLWSNERKDGTVGWTHKLEKSKQRSFYEETLIPFAKLLITVMDNGLHVDFDVLREIRSRMMRRCSSYERKVRAEFHGVVLSSPKQMRYLLFEHLKLPVVKYTGNTKKRTPSTDQEVLDKLSKKEPRLVPLSKARKLRSRISREVDPLFDLADDEGLVHTDFNFGSIVTGRLSSSNPNLQNVARDAEHKACFTSRFLGGMLIVGDYKQHELRIFAAQAGEKKFLNRWKEDINYDVHQETAEELEKERSTAKNCNFAIIYDITPKGLSEKYDIPLSEAREILKKWMKMYPAIPLYHLAIRLQMEEFGYVETLFGRRRHVWNPKNGHQCRQGYNCVAQTPAVELSYMAMLRIQSVFEKKKMKSLLVLQVHDSVVVDAPKGEVNRSSKIVEVEMMRTKPVTADGIKIPIAVDLKVVDHL